MDGTLDARTWLTILGIVVGFFLVPFAMLVLDHRRQHQLRRQPPSRPSPVNRTGDETRLLVSREEG